MISDSMNYIYSVKGLLIPKQECRERIIEGINEYVEFIPGLVETLKVNLSSKRTAGFIVNMETTLTLLNNVYARRLAADAEAILKEAKRGQTEECRKLITPFVTDLLALSIEMQMAQDSGLSDTVIKQNNIEVYADIVNNVTVIGKLAAEAEYTKARDMLADMTDLEGDATASRLAEALTRDDSDNAKQLVKELRERYIDLIVELGGSKSSFEQKILAVDDRVEILATVGRILKERYKVLCALGGTAAVKTIAEQRFDLFILDIDMPGMDGYSLAKKIRSDKVHVKTPIIFLTSSGNKESVVKAIQSGGNDFIVKPPNHDTLLSKAAKFLL